SFISTPWCSRPRRCAIWSRRSAPARSCSVRTIRSRGTSILWITCSPPPRSPTSRRPRSSAATRRGCSDSRYKAAMDAIYESESLPQVLLVTGLIGGGAACLTGQAIARTWRPFWHVIVYIALLGAAVRFVHFALFQAVLIAPAPYAVDTFYLLVLGSL